jgi:hypothetical protein
MDHTRVNIHPTQMSCGVMELSRINDDVVGVLYAIAGRLYHPSRGDPCAFFVFSDVVEETSTNSSRLVAKIAELGLGAVGVGPGVAENPKTGNMIVVYTWLIEHILFKEWYAKERVRKLRKVGA